MNQWESNLVVRSSPLQVGELNSICHFIDDGDWTSLSSFKEKNDALPNLGKLITSMPVFLDPITLVGKPLHMA